MALENSLFNLTNIITYAVGVLTTVIGVFSGYILSAHSNKKKLDKYEKLFFHELSEIKSAYSSWLRQLFKEFADPNVDSINYPPKIDFDFIKSIQLVLSENVNIDQRKLFRWLVLSNQLLTNNFKYREQYSRKIAESKLTHLDPFYSSIIIIELALAINVLDKSIKKKSFVKISESVDRIEVLKYACEASNIEFFGKFCQDILKHSQDDSFQINRIN